MQCKPGLVDLGGGAVPGTVDDLAGGVAVPVTGVVTVHNNHTFSQ